mmetsp:Transcript_124225/g.362619  ORF Transcript_124225/g.362619 Transcript_124225/m.362619 type:complete len:316 (-) Transcript_124225:104-1051(-)
MLCNGRPASNTTAQSRSASSSQRAMSFIRCAKAGSSGLLSRISQAPCNRTRKVRVDANSQNMGSGSNAATLKGCISKPMSRCFELHAWATMTSRNSSNARHNTVGLVSGRELCRMQVVTCASYWTSSSGQLSESDWLWTSRVLRKRRTSSSISRSPAAAMDSSSELEACAARPTMLSRCCTKRCLGKPCLAAAPLSGRSVWKWAVSLGSACSKSSCKQDTAKTFVPLRGARRFRSSPPPSSREGPAMEAPSSCSSRAASSRAGALCSSLPSAPRALGGRARMTSRRAWSHAGSCCRPRCRTSARASSCSASASGA